MVYEKPEPLTDARYVREVPSASAPRRDRPRIDEAAVREAVEELVDEGVEALTVCLINASRTAPRAGHRRDRRRGRARPAGLDLVRDPSRVPRVRAHRHDADQRICRPCAREVPLDLRDALAEAHVRAAIQVVRSDGGLMSLDAASQNAVRTVSRGPPAGSAARPSSPRAPASTAFSPSTWAARRPTPPSAFGPARDHARDEGRRLPRRARSRRRQHRRPRRVDHVHRRGDRRA